MGRCSISLRIIVLMLAIHSVLAGPVIKHVQGVIDGSIPYNVTRLRALAERSDTNELGKAFLLCAIHTGKEELNPYADLLLDIGRRDIANYRDDSEITSVFMAMKYRNLSILRLLASSPFLDIVSNENNPLIVGSITAQISIGSYSNLDRIIETLEILSDFGKLNDDLIMALGGLKIVRRGDMSDKDKQRISDVTRHAPLKVVANEELEDVSINEIESIPPRNV